MKPATEILLSAAFALTPEENWSRRMLARNAQGRRVDEGSPTACRFCLVGAIFAASVDLKSDRTHRSSAFDFVGKVTRGRFGEFNDTHTHAEVLEALYRAAELSEAS